MRWCTIFECPQKESEFMLLFLFIHSQCSKHFLLQFALENTDATTPNFVAIQHHIVGVGLDIGIWMTQVFGCMFNNRTIMNHLINLRWFGRCERMMTGYPTVSFFIIFEQREVDYPE